MSYAGFSSSRALSRQARDNPLMPHHSPGTAALDDLAELRTAPAPTQPPHLYPTRTARALGAVTVVDVLLYRLSSIALHNSGTFASSTPGGPNPLWSTSERWHTQFKCAALCEQRRRDIVPDGAKGCT